MGIDRINNLFIDILRYEMTGMDKEGTAHPVDNNTLLELYKLSKRHDLAHIIAGNLDSAGLLDESETSAKFRKQLIMSVYRNRQMQFEYAKIRHILEENSIPFIPLKGAVLRQYYPKESMRTSCDIDILVHDGDLERAIEALCGIGYKSGEREFHDVSLFSPSGVHLELHFSILETVEKLDRVLSKAWDHAKLKDGSKYEYEFEKEFFYFHIMAHAAYHFTSGGFAVRALLDVYVMKYNMGVSCKDAEDLLSMAGIYKFAEEIEAISDYCFRGGQGTELTSELIAYFFTGRMYGDVDTRVAMYKSEKKSTLSYLIHRIFPPHSTMAEQYKRLKKHPVLLPWYWVLRLVKKLFAKRIKSAANEARAAASVSDEKVLYIKELRSRLQI